MAGSMSGALRPACAVSSSVSITDDRGALGLFSFADSRLRAARALPTTRHDKAAAIARKGAVLVKRGRARSCR